MRPTGKTLQHLVNIDRFDITLPNIHLQNFLPLNSRFDVPITASYSFSIYTRPKDRKSNETHTKTIRN